MSESSLIPLRYSLENKGCVFVYSSIHCFILSLLINLRCKDDLFLCHLQLVHPSRNSKWCTYDWRSVLILNPHNSPVRSLHE